MIKDVLRVSSCLTLSLFSILFILGLISFIEHRNQFTFRNPAYRWRNQLLMTSFMGSLVAIIDVITSFGDWRDNPTGCSITMTTLVIVYIIEKQSLNLFLYDRAKIVHNSLSLGMIIDKYLMWLRWILWISVVIGMPVAFYWTAFVAFEGHVDSDNNCMFKVILPAVPVAFAVADTILAAGMLIIFIAPLLKHQGSLQTGKHTRETLQRVIRHNLKLSLIAICSGVVGLTALAVCNWINDGRFSDLEFLPSLGLTIIIWDNLISVTAAHLMTSNWLPKELIKKRKKFLPSPKNHVKIAKFTSGLQQQVVVEVPASLMVVNNIQVTQTST